MRVVVFFHIKEAFCNKFHSLKGLKCPSDASLQHQGFFWFSKKTKISEPPRARKRSFLFPSQVHKRYTPLQYGNSIACK